jgi:hypothetical protein
MQINGYALVDSGSNVIQRWVSIPQTIVTPAGTVVYNAAVGWTDGAYSITTLSWTDIGLPVTVPLGQLLGLFTHAEQVAMCGSGDGNILLFMFLAAASGATLNAASFTTALNYLVSKSIITPARMQQILANQAQ